MALTPSTPDTSEDKRAQQKVAQDEALLREVDDAFRQGQFAEFANRYGRPLFGAIVLGLLAFGGYLYWDSRQEAELEAQSEQLVAALDQIQAGNFDTGDKMLDGVASDGRPGAAAVAVMLKGGVAAERGNTAEAAKLFARVANDETAPAELRNLATIREIALTFDRIDPAIVITRLKPLAVPGNPWFGSAGELVAMAYRKQGKMEEAGTLFAEIAKSEDVPSTLRSRSRQMAGLLGVDAVEDVDKLLEEQNQDQAPAGAVTQ